MHERTASDRSYSYSIEELRRRSVDLRSLGDLRLVTLEDGPGRGQRLLLARNAAGVEFEIAVDRGFDLCALRFRGINLGWNSPVGLRAPGFPHDLESGIGMLRTLDGFLVTCGLDHYGEPVEGPADHFIYPARRIVHYPLHGRVAREPAMLVGYGMEESGRSTLWCEGEVRQAAVFGEVLMLRRRIELDLFGNQVRLTDIVTNRGFRPSRHAVLYHINLGFPLLDSHSQLVGGFGAFEKTFASKPPVPADDISEMDDSIEPQADTDGWVRVGMYNPRLLDGVALKLSFLKAQLPRLNLWRCWQSGLFVMGLEPCTGLKADALSYEGPGTPHFLAPGESRRYELIVELNDCPGLT